MKFLKSERETFGVTNFTPGPGYYIKNKNFSSRNNNEQDLQQQFRSASSFARDNRIEYLNTSKNSQNPGPGQYCLTQDMIKNNQKNQNRQMNQHKKFDPAIFKVNAIPSIPSKQISTGYQEIGEGLLILMKEPRKQEKDNKDVGPGYYNSNLSQIKPKTLGFKIIQSRIKQNQPPPKINEMMQNELMKLIQVPRQQKTSANSKRSEFFKNKEDSNSDFNLEMLQQRGKKLKKQDDIPPVGYYYDPEKQSTFHIKEKPIEFQCFESMQERFEQKPNSVRVGPGDYELVHIDKVKGLAQFTQSPKLQDFQHFIDYSSQIPGPASYVIPSQFIRQQEQQIKKNQIQSNIIFNSAFGSGTSRFNLNQETLSEQLPGPGQYNKNILKQYQKKQKQTMYVYPQQNDNIDETQQIDQNKNIKLELVVAKQDNKQEQYVNLKEQNELNRTQTLEQFDKMHKKIQSSSFFSKVRRFTEISKQFQNTLGPGSYTIKFPKQQQSFNQGKQLLGKESRGTLKQIQNVPRNIGPGTYDYSVDPVKEKKIYNIKIN